MKPACDSLLKFAVFIVCVTFIYFFCVTFVPIPESGSDNAKYITGFLVGTGLATIIGFYWRRHTDGEPDIPPIDPIKPKGDQGQKTADA